MPRYWTNGQEDTRRQKFVDEWAKKSDDEKMEALWTLTNKTDKYRELLDDALHLAKKGYKREELDRKTRRAFTEVEAETSPEYRTLPMDGVFVQFGLDADRTKEPRYIKDAICRNTDRWFNLLRVLPGSMLFILDGTVRSEIDRMHRT